MGKEYQLSDEGYNKIYDRLRASNEDSIQDLKLREIPIFAKLIAAIKNLAESKYTVITDSEEIGNALKACDLKLYIE